MHTERQTGRSTEQGQAMENLNAYQERLFQLDTVVSRVLPLGLLEPSWTISRAQVEAFVGKLADHELAELFHCDPRAGKEERYKKLLASGKGWLVEGLVQAPSVASRSAVAVVYSYCDDGGHYALAYGETLDDALERLIEKAAHIRQQLFMAIPGTATEKRPRHSPVPSASSCKRRRTGKGRFLLSNAKFFSASQSLR